MDKDIKMVYKTHSKYQEVEGLVSFLQSSGIQVIRSPHSVVASALDLINGTCLFVSNEQEAEAKALIEEYFNENPEFVDLPEELKEEE